MTRGNVMSQTPGGDIANWIDDNNLVLLNNGKPTFLSARGTYTHIDISICSPEIGSGFQWQPYHDKFKSEHFPIIIKSDASTTIDPSALR